MILQLATRNIWRNSRRTLITMASVTFAVMLASTMKSLQEGVFSKLIDDLVGHYSGHIQIHGKGYFDAKSLDYSISIPDTALDYLKQAKNVRALAPRLESYVLVAADSATIGGMMVGVDPICEAGLSNLDARVIEGAYFRTGDNALIVAEKFAEKLRVGIGDTLALIGQGYHGITAADKYVVCALARFSTPALNESLLFLPLPAAQKMLGTGKQITSIAVSVLDAHELDKTRKSMIEFIGPAFEVYDWKQMMPDIENHIQSDSKNFYLFFGILYLLIGMGMFGTVLMMVNERRDELGMLIAIGMSRARIAGMLLLETVIIALIGTVVGLLVGVLIVWYFTEHPIRFGAELAESYRRFGFDPEWPAILNSRIFIDQSIIVLVISLLVSLYPYGFAMRLTAMDARRR
jgi:putative ABC transport system permease protein